ncbi:hypothetical protein ACHQM5_009308 [Ranunculus cassubicifolius]
MFIRFLFTDTHLFHKTDGSCADSNQKTCKRYRRPPSNPADRTVITFAPPPADQDFVDGHITRVISHNCVNGWPSTAVTWAEVGSGFKTLAWEDFTKRYTWDPSIDEKVKACYESKCAARTKGHFCNAHKQAKQKAENVHPNQGQ